MNCVAYALHCTNKVKLGLFYLIDLHAGTVINCVDLKDLIFGIKVTVLYITIGWWIVVIHRDDITQGVKPDLSRSLQGL